jgi:hypothetical protein
VKIYRDFSSNQFDRPASGNRLRISGSSGTVGMFDGGYSSGGGWFLWPGSLGLLIIVQSWSF